MRQIHLQRQLARRRNKVIELKGTTTAELANALNQMESSLNYGEKAKLSITSFELPNVQELNQFYYDLVSAGFHVSKPTVRIIQDLSMTEITLTKGSPIWPLLISMIPTIMIGSLVAFGIVKIEAITKALVPLLLIAGGVIIATIAAISASPRAAGVAERAAGVAEKAITRKISAPPKAATVAKRAAARKK